MSTIREAILNKINLYYIPAYGNRFLYSVPERNNYSPNPARAAARRIADEEKARKNHLGSWSEGFDFSSLDDENLVEAFERIIRISTYQM